MVTVGRFLTAAAHEDRGYADRERESLTSWRNPDAPEPYRRWSVRTNSITLNGLAQRCPSRATLSAETAARKSSNAPRECLSVPTNYGASSARGLWSFWRGDSATDYRSARVTPNASPA
jgi:hypothetical protein